MQEQHAFPFLREILLFLALAGILIPLLQRLRINQVLGFLAVGAFLGPFGLGRMAEDFAPLGLFTFPNNDNVAMLAELGVLFLMFMIGLELSAARLWAMRRWVFGTGSAQVVLCAALHVRSEAAMVAVIVLTNMAVSIFMFVVGALPGIRDHLSGPVPVWNGTIANVLLLELLVFAMAVVLPLATSSRRRDFV